MIVAGAGSLQLGINRIDPGVQRCFSKCIRLSHFTIDEATKFLESKFEMVYEYALFTYGHAITFNASLMHALIAMSGCHPHLLQLLGSGFIELLNERQSFTFDSSDMFVILKRICFELRGDHYDVFFHDLDLARKSESLRFMLVNADQHFPTIVAKQSVRDQIPHEDLQYFLENKIFEASDSSYILIDEFTWVWIELKQNASGVHAKHGDKLLSYLSRFNLSDVRSDRSVTQQYIRIRFEDQLLDSEKRKIIYQYVERYADENGDVLLNDVYDDLSALIPVGAAFSAYVDELVTAGKIRCNTNRKGDAVLSLLGPSKA